MPRGSSDRLVLALILILPALWSVNFLVARMAHGVIAPNALALWRWVIAGGLFCFLARRELRADWRIALADWRHMLVLGALGMWICGAWVYRAGQTSSAANMALIYSISPVLIVLVSRLWLREPFDGLQGCGVALALAGVLHVVLKGAWTDLARVRLVAGDGWIFGAAVSWALFSILLQRWRTPLGTNARLGAISLAGVLALLPFAAWEAATGPLPPLSIQGALLALAAALLPGYGAYLAYSVLLEKRGAARVGVVLYLAPLYAAAMAWLFLGEALHPYHAVGLALVLPGIYLVNRRRRP